ncbi:MAG: hypothetical protein ACK5EA_22100, partial [Planctomycetaceae bacterium]
MSQDPESTPSEATTTAPKRADKIKPVFYPKCALIGLLVAIPCLIPMYILRFFFGFMHMGGFWLPYAHSDEFALLFGSSPESVGKKWG